MPPRRALLDSHFRSVLSPEPQVSMLSAAELQEVLGASHPEDYFVGGVVNRADQTVILYRGTLEPLVVPFDWFLTPASGQTPDFRRLKLLDCGQTVALGKHQTASDAILFEFDEEARKRQKANAVLQDPSLGGSIRRLRLQKGLPRSAFHGINVRTVARIEQGLIRKPRQDTLNQIAKRLRVSSDALASY